MRRRATNASAFVNTIHNVRQCVSCKAVTALRHKRRIKSKISILDDFNVFEAHLSEGFVYYRAETLDGKLLTQVYDIEKAQSYEVKDWSSKMVQIQAIRK